MNEETKKEIKELKRKAMQQEDITLRNACDIALFFNEKKEK